MQLQADAHGFIIGEKRLKEMAQGITHTEDNTKRILSVLSEKIEELRKESERGNNLQGSTLDRHNRTGQSSSAGTPEAQNIRRSVEASEELAVATTRLVRQTKVQDGETPRTSTSVPSVSDRVERERDGKGRFIGSGSSSSDSREVKSFLGHVKDFIPPSHGVDTGGIDPTVDAVKELAGVVSPVGRVFGGMGARAISIFRGRAKKRRNEEILPDEQVQANDTQERHDRQRNKLLERLINVVAVSGNGRGAGLLGGMLGGGGGGGGRGGFLKGLLRKIPILGALLGGGMLASNWSESTPTEKGGGIGSLVGMGIGGVLGSFLGIGGTIAGGALGSHLGGIFGEKVGKWTEGLEDQDLGDMFKDFLSGIFDGATTPVTSSFSAIRTASDIFGNIATGFGSSGSGSSGAVSSASNSTKVGKLSADKAQSISRVANNIGVDPNDLASIISFETVGTFSPNIRNPKSSATGLIQKMGDGATKSGNYNNGKYYGMTRDQFGGLSFDEQMKYVERYYKERGFDGKKKRSLADAYTAVSGYGYKEGSQAYELNKVWDTNKDGVIDKNEATNAPAFQQHVKKWIPDVPTAKGIPYSREVINGQKNNATTPFKVPQIQPEVVKYKPLVTANASKAPSDTGISQIVSDRSLAHIFSGSVGFDAHSA